MTKWVYDFDEVELAEKETGSWDGVRGLLGGKGANLGDMTRIGVPVPPGFTITADACNAYLEGGDEFLGHGRGRLPFDQMARNEVDQHAVLEEGQRRAAGGNVSDQLTRPGGGLEVLAGEDRGALGHRGFREPMIELGP